jgi:hypothetical protein
MGTAGLVIDVRVVVLNRLVDVACVLVVEKPVLELVMDTEVRLVGRVVDADLMDAAADLVVEELKRVVERRVVAKVATRVVVEKPALEVVRVMDTEVLLVGLVVDADLMDAVAGLVVEELKRVVERRVVAKVATRVVVFAVVAEKFTDTVEDLVVEIAILVEVESLVMDMVVAVDMPLDVEVRVVNSRRLCKALPDERGTTAFKIREMKIHHSAFM